MAKSKLVNRIKRRRSLSRNPAPSANPPMLQDMAELVGPGFGAFATTRLATRAAQTQIEKRWPGWGKHAGAVASIGSFLAAWFLAHRWKPLERFHTPIVMGAGIAAAQSLLQLYVPRLGWVVSDASADAQATTTTTVTNNGTQIQATSGSEDDFEIVDENAWYAYNDARDPGPTYQRARQQNAQRQPAAENPAQQAVQPSDDDSIFDVLEDDEMQAQGWGAGLAQN